MNLSNAALTGEGEDGTKSEQRVAAAHTVSLIKRGRQGWAIQHSLLFLLCNCHKKKTKVDHSDVENVKL